MRAFTTNSRRLSTAMATKNAFYAQSGGVTAVINASAAGVIQTARKYPEKIGKVYAGRNGIIGALREELIDTSLESDEAIEALIHTPGGAFGSCRHKLKNFSENKEEYERLIEVFRAHDIGYFFYNGGGDSQDTAYKVSQLADRMGYPITCIGVPKTVDNDLPFTDCCPGFGSVAKYIATSTLEASLDIRSMCESSTKVFILEVMGRHAGWIAAAGGLAGEGDGEPPHIILFPEVPFNREAFLARVEHCVENYGYCVIVASEGAQYEDGRFLAEAGAKDAFGHTQLGGVAPTLANMVKQATGYKYHWAVADYLQRSARHLASATDVKQAWPTIVREQSDPYRWHIGEAPLSEVANQEKKMPIHFITDDGFGITGECREYLQPLIEGENFPPFEKGLPKVAKLKNQLIEKKLKTAFDI
jgi:6-phosphofructokinase 1